PAASNFSAACRRRSCSTSWWPAFCRLLVMPEPIRPRPMNPTLISFPPPMTQLGTQQLVEKRLGARLGTRRGGRIVGQPMALAVSHHQRAIRQLAVEAVIGV